MESKNIYTIQTTTKTIRKKPPKVTIPTSPQGTTALREEDFRKMYEWQLMDYAEDNKKIITLISVKDYFHIGIECIRNEITFSAFVREAILAKREDVQKISKKLKKDTTCKENPNQGSLF